VIVNIFAIIVLFILFIAIGGKRHRFLLRDQVVFQWMLVTNIAILFLDAGAWMLNGQTFEGARVLNLIYTAVYYILDPVMSLLYIYYCEVKLGTPPRKRKRLLMLYCFPVVVNLVLSLLSVRYSLMFRISESNVYGRGPLLYLSFILSYVLLPVAFGRVLYYRNKLEKEGKRNQSSLGYRGIASLLTFPLVPLAGGLIQIWFCPVTVVWLSTVIALLIVFINIQNAEISTDSLTGLYNRRQTDSYLQNLIQPNAREKAIGLVMLDMDNFKQINDRFGHLTGDYALRTMADVLRAVCDRDTFFSRYGGDEFVIVTRQKSLFQIEALLEKINLRLEECCRSACAKYMLSISAGVALWKEGMDSVDALFAVADEQLYRNKSKMNRRMDDPR